MGEDNEDSPITKSGVFFNDLYHRFILTPKTGKYFFRCFDFFFFSKLPIIDLVFLEMKCLCLQAMTIVYGRHHSDIGPFHDTKYIVAMLDRTSDRVER